jgi:hypothetical protein
MFVFMHECSPEIHMHKRAAVICWAPWCVMHGAGEFEGSAKPPAIRDPKVLFDTYNAHVRHCKASRAAAQAGRLGL